MDYFFANSHIFPIKQKWSPILPAFLEEILQNHLAKVGWTTRQALKNLCPVV